MKASLIKNVALNNRVGAFPHFDKEFAVHLVDKSVYLLLY